MRKDTKGLTLEYARASFYLGVSYFLEHKSQGGFLNFCCFSRTQGSGKEQHCDCVKSCYKTLKRQEAFTEGCNPGRTNIFPLQCHAFWSSPFPNKTDRMPLLLNPLVILPCCSVMHLSPGSTWLHSVFCQHSLMRKNNFPLSHAEKFSLLFPVQTANSDLSLPLLSKDLVKAPESLLARSSINSSTAWHPPPLRWGEHEGFNPLLTIQKSQRGKLCKT